MTSKYVSPANISSDDNSEGMPMDDDGNIDWMKFYQKKTPQIDKKELEKIKEQEKGKKSPFTPEYNDDPFLNDEEIYNKMNEEGNVEFIDSGKKMDDFESFEENVIKI